MRGRRGGGARREREGDRSMEKEKNLGRGEASNGRQKREDFMRQGGGGGGRVGGCRAHQGNLMMGYMHHMVYIVHGPWFRYMHDYYSYVRMFKKCTVKCKVLVH